MSTYSPFQIFWMIFCGMGVLLGPMVIDNAGGHTSPRLDPDCNVGMAWGGALAKLLDVVIVLPASENSGTRAREEGGGNNGLLETPPTETKVPVTDAAGDAEVDGWE